jgi:hypothetical protein
MLDGLAFLSFRHRRRDTRPVMTACRLSVSKKSTFDEAEHIAAADDDVVNDSHVDEFKTRFHPLCDQLVRVALIADHGRVLGFILECHLPILASRLMLTSA